MAARLFQGIILQMKDSVDRTMGVIDSTGAIVACTELPRIGEMREDAASELAYTNDMVRVGGMTYKPLAGRSSRFEYAVFVHGEDELAKSICGLAAVSINSVKSFYDEKHDKTTFIKNIILDNILPGDIYIKSRELHFGSDVTRAVFLIRQVEKAEIAAVDVLTSLFPDRQKDFVININETDIALVKEIRAGIDSKDLEKLARSIVDTLGGEFYTQATVGIGTVVEGIKDLARSFKAVSYTHLTLPTT